MVHLLRGRPSNRKLLAAVQGRILAQVRPGLRGARVELERRLDATLWVRFRGSYFSLRPSPPPATPFGLLGLLPRKTRNQNAYTFPLPTTLGGGHFYLAKKRPFLPCVDTQTGISQKPRESQPTLFQLGAPQR